MDRCAGAAARLPGNDRKDRAIQALGRSEAVSDLTARHGASRKFVYQQTHKAGTALGDAFSPAAPDDEVLFELAVTKAWLRQVIVGLALICRSSYRGVVEFTRDLLGVPVSVGCVHDVIQAATREASAINHDQDLPSQAGRFRAPCVTQKGRILNHATVRHRTVRTKGALSQDTARLMVFKLVMAASKTWRRLKGENQRPKVVQGVIFRNGVEVTDTPAQNAA